MSSNNSKNSSISCTIYRIDLVQLGHKCDLKVLSGVKICTHLPPVRTDKCKQCRNKVNYLEKNNLIGLSSQD